jgi:hypothetical protein
MGRARGSFGRRFACAAIAWATLCACESVDARLLQDDAAQRAGPSDAARPDASDPRASVDASARGDDAGATGASDAAGDTGPGDAPDAGACRPNSDTSDEVCPEVCPEACNGEDDDCDRRIDERPASSRACALAHATALCESGTCAIAACDPGYRDCDAEAANGCEASLDDVAHCGACGQACEIDHAEAACVERACAVEACLGAWDDCDGAAPNGCETSLATLVDCGGCGAVCGGLADATPDCAGGSCAIGTCLGNHDDCDDEPENGCETPLDTLTDCGACDVPCALAACAGGVCSAIVCIDPTADCDGDGVDCETNLATDVANCGGCKIACAFTVPTPHATLACEVKDCVASCEPGWDDCDESYATGCETAVDVPARCGDCAIDCGDLDHVATTACDGATFTCEVVSCAAGWGDCDHAHATGCEQDLFATANCGGCASDGANEPCEGLAQVTASTCDAGACAITACDGGFDDCDGLAATGCEHEVALAGPCALRKRLTIEKGFVDAALVDFPVLVRVTDAELQKARADALDLVFTDAGGTVLDHDVEQWSVATGTLIAWVRVPAISATVDTDFYLYYGDAVARVPDPAGAWDASFKYVWHMAQDPSAGTVKDATATGAHATSSGSMTSTDLVAAIVGNGIDFDGSNDRLLFTNSFTGPGPHTIATWVSQRSSGSGDDTAIFVGTATTGDARILFTSKSGGEIRLSFQSNTVDTNDDIRNVGWRHLVWTHDGAQSTLYLDGAHAYGPASPGGTNNTVGTSGEIGAHANGDWLNGQLDELRVSTVVRSTAWIRAEYQNQRPGSTFLTVGPEHKAPPLP